MAAAREALVHRLGREPKASEIAAELKVSVETLRQWEVDVESTVEVSLDVAPRALREDADVTTAAAIADDRAPSADERITQQQRIALLAVAIRGLRSQERTVLALYFYEELTLQDIAQVLGLSASRISQIRAEALEKLRRHLGRVLD
jgi:RNA polymerase sigma factor for flagellar operon FliA